MWLKFNETSGTTATDSSGQGNTGTLTGGAAWQPAGEIAGAIAFDGTTGYVNVPDATSLDNTSALTVAFWFKSNSLAATQGLVSKRDGITTNNAYTTFLQTDGHINVDLDTNNDRFISNTVFSTGTWYHVAVVFDGAQPAAQRAKLYVNGALDITASETSASIPNYPSTLKVGSTHTGANFLNGSVDDVRLYRRALSATEIDGLANAAIAPGVSAGAAPSATSAVAASLNGSASNELSGALTLAWSLVSGPGMASFGNPSAASTNVTFGQAGTYVLRLTATNTAASTFGNLTVNVSPNPAVFPDWISSFYPGINDPAIVGAQAMPKNDGIMNLEKFALGLDPTKPGAASWTTGHAGLPIPTTANISGANYLALSVRRPIGLTGITYQRDRLQRSVRMVGRRPSRCSRREWRRKRNGGFP